MTATDAGFDILLEDGPVLVVDKPGGLATQAPPQFDSLEARVKRFLKTRGRKPGKVYLGVPHRLDRPSSGALVFAKHSRAARRLAEQFEGTHGAKVVPGNCCGAIWACWQGTWTDHIRKIPDVARAEIVPPNHPDGRQATMHYEVITQLASPAPVCCESRWKPGACIRFECRPPAAAIRCGATRNTDQRPLLAPNPTTHERVGSPCTPADWPSSIR